MGQLAQTKAYNVDHPEEKGTSALSERGELCR